jgi:hypothetical protein
MPHAAMNGQELLPRKSFHKSSPIKSVEFYAAKATVKPKLKSVNSSIDKGLQIMETIEWE